MSRFFIIRKVEEPFIACMTNHFISSIEWVNREDHAITSRARHYTDFSPEKLQEIYEKVQLQVLK